MVDANVLVAGTIWPRYPYEVLQSAARHHYQLVLSPKIIDEARKAILKIAPIEGHRLEKILLDAEYQEIDAPTDDAILANLQLVRDPNDVHVVLAAIEAGIDILVTQDKDFTELSETTAFLRQHFDILLPGTFLREYMGWTSEALEAIRTRTWRDLE